MHEIHLTYTRAKILNVSPEDQEFLIGLDFELSFRVAGAEYSPAFKAHRWDGRTRLLSKNLFFNLGLLETVKQYYIKKNKEFVVIDNRVKPIVNESIDILPKLTEYNKIPYPYQLEILEKAKENYNGIIRAATGAGKELCITLITAHFNKPTCVFVIGKDLLFQMHSFFSSIFNEEIGIIGDGYSEVRRINIVSIWSLGKAFGTKFEKVEDEGDEKELDLDEQKILDIQNMLKNTKLAFFDECHMGACNNIVSIFNHLESVENLYGCSATPQRDDNQTMVLTSIFGEKIVDIGASELIKKGYLVKPIIRFINVPKMNDVGTVYQTIYKNYIVNNEVRNTLIVKGAESLVEQGFSTLLLYSDLAHGQILYKLLKDKISCLILSGSDSSDYRKEVKNKLESGEIKCILASKIFDIGLNLPSLSAVLLGGSGKSSIRSMQRIGRVIRKYPNKKFAAVIDFYDNAKYLKDHSLTRKAIYETEEEFQVIWPNLK